MRWFLARNCPQEADPIRVKWARGTPSPRARSATTSVLQRFPVASEDILGGEVKRH